MRIQEIIKEDLKRSIKKGDSIRKENLKIIVGELQRQKNKLLSDDETVQILRKLEKWENDRLKICKLSGSTYLDIIRFYIPIQLADEQIEKWIKENVDFTKFKNKLGAIKIVLDHFGTSTSGGQIRNILLRI